ncbi:MAG: hypothetical protein ACR2H3_12985 [Acidimicrobiales bacterium]
MTQPADQRPISALPSPLARGLAFASIVLAGACGGLIGYSITTIGCDDSCSTTGAIGGLVGALMAAGGVAVVAILALRAMGEWKRLREEEIYND